MAYAEAAVSLTRQERAEQRKQQRLELYKEWMFGVVFVLCILITGFFEAL